MEAQSSHYQMRPSVQSLICKSCRGCFACVEELFIRLTKSLFVVVCVCVYTVAHLHHSVSVTVEGWSGCSDQSSENRSDGKRERKREVW